MIIKGEIGEKGEIVIPNDICEHLGLNVGINIILEVEDDKLIIQKEGDAEKIMEDFLDTPKIKRKVSVKELKEVYDEQYERHIS